MPKVKSKLTRNTSLADDIISVRTAKSSTRQKERIKAKYMKDDAKAVIDSKMSKKVVDLAKSQQHELKEDNEETGVATNAGVGLIIPEGQELADLINEIENDRMHMTEFVPPEGIEEDFEKYQAIDKDTRIETCMQKVSLIESQLPPDPSTVECVPIPSDLEHFKKLGYYFSKYRSGKIPQSFKLLPTLNCWKDYLFATRPDEWTAAAMFQATKIFANRLDTNDLIYFYMEILVPRVRDDMVENKKINYHLYQALKITTLNPAAFFEGIIFNFIEAKDCRLNEAIKICSLISSCKLQTAALSVGLFRLCTLYPISPPLCLFIRTLIEKKTAFAVKTFNAVIEFFIRAKKDEKIHPVIWHQCLLSFVNLYINVFNQTQKQDLLKLIKVQYHDKISPEIRKALTLNMSREEEDSIE